MIETEQTSDIFSSDQLADFERDGFLILRGLLPESYVRKILEVTRRDTSAHYGDIEYEADVQYPGAPASLDAEGGRTIRRLRQAFSRDPVFSALVKEPFLLKRLQQLLGPQVVMPLAHHNCVMTKHPKFSSDTGWHQDTRFWSFERPDLVNIWLALGPETVTNGCLRLLPGTHRMPVDRRQLDEGVFLRTDLPENQPLLDQAVTAELQPGDVLFFHARCFHAATRNFSEATKYSAVFTFRALNNPPQPNTRSAELPELLL
ncbi:MAG: phytanoyl-CoA dioxygenase family protein [Planctomycetaceae bacterium]